MMEMRLQSGNLGKCFDKLNEKFGGCLHNDSGEYLLEVDNGLGWGEIKGIQFEGGITYLELDVVFTVNLKLVIDMPEESPILFAYCSRGSAGHSFESEDEKRTLEKFQTAIITNKPRERNVLYFQKDSDVKVSLIAKNQDSRLKNSAADSLDSRLKELFLTQTRSANTIYIGSYNLKIIEKLIRLESITQKGVVRHLLIEGLVHMILALEIEQHHRDSRKKDLNGKSLTVAEMDAVKEVSQFINNYPEVPHNISQLCRKSGLSPAKLQEGFKMMHDTTVCDYIREVRLMKAEQLLTSSDMNVSEIVYSVGFTSRSYFSKIFKAKYECSPKHYKNGQHAASGLA